MNVVVVYCYPMTQASKYFGLAKRFSDTWRQYDPGHPCQLVVGYNGAKPTALESGLFHGLGATALARDNSGWDIGLYQEAAEKIPADLMVFFGAPVHFYRPGWLKRMVDVYVERGPNLYGCWGYHYPNWHIRTTCFWCHPQLLNSYPFVIGDTRPQRYSFEHGQDSFTRWVLKAGLEADIVSWDNLWPEKDWDQSRQGVGDCLCFDQHTHR